MLVNSEVILLQQPLPTLELERQMLNDILPFIHIAARNDDFKIINHLADG